MRQIVHVEIPSADNDAQKAFYSALLGWQANDVPMGPDYSYTIFDLGDERVVGLAEVGEDVKVDDVLIYFGSDDLDADMARVSELGGQVIVARQEVPGYGALGMFLDPTGNRVAFWQSVDEAQE